MLQIIAPQNLNAHIAPHELSFSSTAELLSVEQVHGWVAQADAKKSATFGLNLQQPGFNLLVLGEQGTGRTSLMQSAMQEAALNGTHEITDLVALFNFEMNEKPLFVTLPAGAAVKFRLAMEHFIRQLVKQLSSIAAASATANEHVEKSDLLATINGFITDHFDALQLDLHLSAISHITLAHYFHQLKLDVLEYLEAWQPNSSTSSDNEKETDSLLDSLLSESFLGRYRVNILVGNPSAKPKILAPVIYDNDPSLQSLFGGIESATESSSTPDFMRLRAGNLMRANGGMLMLHLRDLLQDQQNGSQILEKLHRFLRNGTLQIEDLSSGTLSGSSGQTASFANANSVLPVQVKLVLIATREDFYQMLDEKADFFNYFPIKVEFAERIEANVANYAAVAGFVAQKCQQFSCPHFTAEAVAVLIGALQRLEEDQTRISTNFARLERLILESVAISGINAIKSNETKENQLITAHDVKAAIAAKQARHHYVEAQIRDSIIDNELMIQVHGSVVGQVNGLTHIELGDASFGSPVRITARCYAGSKGVINIDREVQMSGPNHDKGIFILQSWLSASFSSLAPLSLNASLVFEQEYNGVEGDSASCAELFALLSALSGLGIKQGLAVTGALNQFGEVMPIGGVNEKIEGYFRVCRAIGLDGKQGVIIPKRNQNHLLLDDEVVDAVAAGQFHIYTIDHVLEGIAHLTDTPSGDIDEQGHYAAESVMGYAQKVLSGYRKTLENNRLNNKV